MEYTLLGRTGVTVSRICLGCMSYGDPKWRSWVLEEKAAMPFFRRAVEAGINFFDTADMYSLGASEEVTGKALREYTRLDEVVLATKVFNPMADGPNMRGLSRKHIQQGCESSLRRLGVETIDLFQVHRFDPDTPIDEMLSALDLLVRQGKVRYIGASSTDAWRFANALSLSERNVISGHYSTTSLFSYLTGFQFKTFTIDTGFNIYYFIFYQNIPPYIFYYLLRPNFWINSGYVLGFTLLI